MLFQRGMDGRGDRLGQWGGTGDDGSLAVDRRWRLVEGEWCYSGGKGRGELLRSSGERAAATGRVEASRQALPLHVRGSNLEMTSPQASDLAIVLRTESDLFSQKRRL